MLDDPRTRRSSKRSWGVIYRSGGRRTDGTQSERLSPTLVANLTDDITPPPMQLGRTPWVDPLGRRVGGQAGHLVGRWAGEGHAHWLAARSPAHGKSIARPSSRAPPII